jgi:SAM-dependent methyltransferase
MRLTERGLPPGARVLELGCGTGNNLRFLAEEGFEAHGLDSSRSAIELAGKQLASWGLEAELQVAELTELPYPDSYFDLVVDRAAVVHNDYHDVVTATGEARRVLKSGGHIVSIGLFGMESPHRLLGVRQGPHTWDCFSGGKLESLGPVCFFDQEDIELLFEGFSEVDWLCHTITGAKSETIEQYFEVRARK